MNPRTDVTTKTGNLTEAPEIGQSKSGTTFARFRIAVELPLVEGDWRGEKETTYYSVVCFGSTAEHVCESLQKGDRVIVTGRGELDTWTGKDGQERTTKKIVADAVGAELRFSSLSIARERRGGGR
jgi:single-strand DNA-binding protein